MDRDENMEIGTWSICGTNDSKVMKILGSNDFVRYVHSVTG